MFIIVYVINSDIYSLYHVTWFSLFLYLYHLVMCIIVYGICSLYHVTWLL
jgi:hypothetical protein